MLHRTRNVMMTAILLGLGVAAAAVAQQCEVRTFLAPATGSLTTDDTFQFLQSCVKGRYVCPYCSFSCNTLPTSGNCPDPWHADNHPSSVPLVDMGARLSERLLSLATPEMEADKYDLELPNAAGTMIRRAILGRPFAPTDSGNTSRSGVYAQVAGLLNNNSSNGPVITSSMHGRFLIVPPNPLLRDVPPTDTAGTTRNLPQRRIMAQASPPTTLGGTLAWAPQVSASRFSGTGAFLISQTDMPSYISIGVNPYRVDDGDYWFVRYREHAVTGGGGVIDVDRIQVELYSVTYGYEGEVNASNIPVVLQIDNGGAQIPFPINVVSDSGAIRVRFDAANLDGTGWSSAASGAGWNTWVCGFMVRSTCKLVPGWVDMQDATTDPPFPKLTGGTGGRATFDFINDTFPGKKQCSYAIDNGVPNFTTESDIEETGAPASVYTLPVDCTGVGQVAVEWAGEAGGAWTPSISNPPTNAVYRRTGGEWQYDASFNPIKDVTNDNVALQTTNYSSALGTYVKLLSSKFFSSRVNVPATGQQWTPDSSVAATNVEPGSVPWRYPRAVIGWLNGGVITGSFGPGARTPARPLSVLNRWDGTTAVQYCTVCGAIWEPGTTVPTYCQFHVPPTSGPATTIVVAGAGTAGYNGSYTLQGSLINGRSYWAKTGGYYLYFSGKWCLSQDTALAFNKSAYADGNGAQPNMSGWVRKKSAASPAPTLSYAPPDSTITQLSPLGGGEYALTHDSWRDTVAYNPDERTAGGAIVKQVLPTSAIQNTGITVNHTANAGAATSDQLKVSVPRYQAPSVPGTGLINDQANDHGYRGGQVYYRNETAVNDAAGLTANWDAFYRNPDTGYLQPQAGVWPFVCPVDGRVYFRTSGGNCPDHPGNALTEVTGRHLYCPCCGAEFATAPDGNVCPFDGAAITAAANTIPYVDAVREEHLAAEEYEPFDLQISVSRRGEFVQATPTAEVGRTAPGVRAQRPDVTVQGLTSHQAFPADVSPLPANAITPSDARINLTNEGNVALSPRLSNTYDFVNGSVADRGQDHYLRVGQDWAGMSYGRKAMDGPLTRDTLVPFNSAYNSAAAWDVYASGVDGAAGTAVYGFLSAGTYGGRPTPKPVPLGQPVGTYTGSHLQYVDSNGNGALDFFSLAGGAATTTATTPYNPTVDLPYEPVLGVLKGQTRVFETRLPQNDYYALDSDPVVLPSPTPGVMQVIWATNRAAVAPGNTAAAGTDPGDLPQSNAPLNLVYITTSGVTGGADDELYRRYDWQSGSGGALTEALAMTGDAGAGTMNGLPWAMYNTNDNSRWAFWHQSLHHAGGVQSTLRYNSTNNWTWPTPGANNFVFDTGLNKQGLRGFWQPGGAWLFWHSGAAGREQLMYRWNFTGTPDSNEAALPVTNRAPAGQTAVPDPSTQGQTDLIMARDQSGAMLTDPIQRPSFSPFTSTKDVSVFNSGIEMSVFFSGLVTAEGQADICWTRFRTASMAPATATDNYGKLPFPRVTNYEEMQAEGMHQRFGSRHLDWLVDRNFAASGPGGAINPAFILQVAFQDTIGDGVARGQQQFGIDWSGGTYDRARGVYRVEPVLYPISGSTVPAQFGIVNGTGWYLRERPNSSRRLAMELNIAAGTVTFSSPLFNEDAPTDPSAALTSAWTLSGAPLDDVLLRVNYTPYIYRVTRSEAQDDCPSASYDPSTAQRLTVFWRRSYPTTDAPHFGRAAFMYKVFTTSIQVGRPPVSGTPTFTNAVTGAAVTAAATPAPIPDAGLYAFDPSLVGTYVNVNYDGVGGTYTERHQIIGWSREMTVPVDTVIGEGALVAVPETFGVPRVEGDTNNLVPAVRYWLFWTSPRGVYDLRLVENNGTRLTPGGGQPYDLAIHPSADIYTAVVAPEFGSLAPERTILTVSNQGT